MNSEPDEEVRSSEGQTVAHPPQNEGRYLDQSKSSAVSSDPASVPVATPREDGNSMLVAEVRTIVAGQNQSQYGHFAVEIGADGQPVELGRGAMGVTYRAVDTVLQRPVALKVISSRLIDSEVLKGRFIREARAAASLRHPNVASIFYLGSTESTYFYAMELVTGETLEQFIEKQGPLDPILALDITGQVTSALVAAHQAGLIHRDIKPANLILTRDEKGRILVKVIDFGLVKLTAEPVDESMSDPGTFLGTPRYASPEQFSGGKIDIRSDLYALGITLWQMLTKLTPFNGTPTQVAAQHLQCPPPIEQLRHLPHPIVSLLAHLLEKNPDDRPQTPEELLVTLNTTRRAIGGQVGVTEGVSWRIQPRWPLFGRGKTPYLVGAVLILIAGAVLLIRFFPTHSAFDRKSVAVLPFDNVGDDNQNAYLSDGITAEVIFQLSQIGELRVVSRDSVLRYKTMPATARKSMREIANELEVATLLESNIQRSADRLKIRSVLYDANSGKQLWSQSYDREMNDLFAIQSDVAEKIVAALQVKLSSEEQNNIQRQPTVNPRAYDLYLRGRRYYEIRRKDDNENAIALFKQSIEQDPEFALGYVGLANCYIERKVRFDGETFWLDSAEDLCRKAITLDDKQARAYNVLARALIYKKRPAAAREAVARALELAPNDEETNFRAASLKSYSGLDRYRLFLKCRLLDPSDSLVAYNLAHISLFWDDDQLRDRWLQRAIHLESNEDIKRLISGEQLVYQKKYQLALDTLRSLAPMFVGYGPYVDDLKYGCWENLGQWADALQLARNTKDTEEDQPWTLLRLIVALNATGQVSDAKEKVGQLLALANKEFAANPDDRYTPYFLAFCYRFLDSKEVAYSYLRPIFPDIIGALPLGRNEYSLRIFSKDREMQELMANFEKRCQSSRVQIHQMDNNP
jgi:serine/threonine protein kinase